MEPPAADAPKKTNPNWLTPQEAGAYAKISPSLIYQLCDERRLAHHRIGGRGKRGKILVHVRDLDAFIEAQRVEAR